MHSVMIRMVTLACTLVVSGSALAHTGTHESGSWFSGFLHPLLGVDHVVALIAIGLWSASAAGWRAQLRVITFLSLMVTGATLATHGIALPGIEVGIAVSVLVAGLLLMTFARLSPVHGTALIALFALFHGQAHGLEMPTAVAPVLYGSGLVISSGLLLVVGTRLGAWLRQSRAEWLLRGGGMLSGAFGAWLLLGA